MMTEDYVKIIIVAVVWIVGIIVTFYGLRSDKYKSTRLSIYQPKPWVFSVVWTFIYLSYLYVWIWGLPSSSTTFLLFAANMIVNLAWTVVFFGLLKFKWGFYIILFLAGWTLLQVFYVYSLKIKESGLSLFLLLIYFSWLCVAGLLNYSYL